MDPRGQGVRDSRGRVTCVRILKNLKFERELLKHFLT